MKKFLALFVLLITICGCGAPPTTSNPSVTQSLQINSSPSSIQVSGTFYDITTGSSTNFGPAGVGTTFTFTTGKHDTVEFKLSFNPATTTSFTYILGTTSSTATSKSDGTYTSSEITF